MALRELPNAIANTSSETRTTVAIVSYRASFYLASVNSRPTIDSIRSASAGLNNEVVRSARMGQVNSALDRLYIALHVLAVSTAAFDNFSDSQFDVARDSSASFGLTLVRDVFEPWHTGNILTDISYFQNVHSAPALLKKNLFESGSFTNQFVSDLLDQQLLLAELGGDWSLLHSWYLDLLKREQRNDLTAAIESSVVSKPPEFWNRDSDHVMADIAQLISGAERGRDELVSPVVAPDDEFDTSRIPD